MSLTLLDRESSYLGQAKQAFVDGLFSVEELEQCVEAILKGESINNWWQWHKAGGQYEPNP